MSQAEGRESVAVLGAGSWGIALAKLLDAAGHEVRLWEFDPPAASRLATLRALPEKLPDIELRPSIEVTNDLSRALSGSHAVLFVTPSSVVRTTALRARDLVPKDALVVSLAKGIEIETGQRMTQIISAELSDRPVVALVGPSHAEEVAREIPTAVVAACDDSGEASRAQSLFSTERFRVYTSKDTIGVELAAALKNIVAIAAGIVDGLGYDTADNLKGALMTRGLAEITRLGVKMGAQPETFAGLSGVGDLITTCLSRHSRNRFVGEQVGRGRPLVDVLASMSMVAEGVNTTKAALRLAEIHQVDMPIARAVASVLFDGRPAAGVLRDLMVRPPQPEIRR
jgi:glycerol-3-phosphate dehydrogenase (NAD(P)+)